MPIAASCTSFSDLSAISDLEAGREINGYSILPICYARPTKSPVPPQRAVVCFRCVLTYGMLLCATMLSLVQFQYVCCYEIAGTDGEYAATRQGAHVLVDLNGTALCAYAYCDTCLLYLA